MRISRLWFEARSRVWLARLFGFSQLGPMLCYHLHAAMNGLLAPAHSGYLLISVHLHIYLHLASVYDCLYLHLSTLPTSASAKVGSASCLLRI